MTTDKQIIIDGVDVSGCPSYKHNSECENTVVWADYCKACSNCVYKLEQQLDKLKVENEKLKNEIEACYNQIEDFDIIATSKYNKLKQAEQKLERIKDIASNYDNCNEVGHYIQDTEVRHALEEVAQAMCDISQIIDEVE